MAFPVVPIVPGVPPLIRDPFAALAVLTLLEQDLLLLAGAPVREQWGIFLDGESVIEAENVLSFGYKQNWFVSDFPLERGAFETYDKVETPFDARIRFSAGGSAADRQALLDSITAIADNTTLYDVATPEVVYRSVTINHVDYERKAGHGVGLLTVDVWLTEARVTGQTEFTNTKSASGSDAQNGGTVQAQPTAAGVDTVVRNYGVE